MHPLPDNTAVRIIANDAMEFIIQHYGNSGRLLGYQEKDCIIYFFESETTLVIEQENVTAWLSAAPDDLLTDFDKWLNTINPADF